MILADPGSRRCADHVSTDRANATGVMLAILEEARMDLLSRVGRMIAGLPERILRIVGRPFTSPEPTGIGRGQVHMGDLDEREAERRRERETWRRPEDPPADSN